MEIITNNMIRIDRLSKYFPEDFGWNKNEIVKIEDITKAIANEQSEEKYPFNPKISMPYEWHIGRIIYFINHSEKIEYINIGSLDVGNFLLPTPVIIEGHHRFLAAMWLYSHGRMEEIYCSYNGRDDILYYLNGINSRMPSKIVEKSDRKEFRNICIINSNNEFYHLFTNGDIIFTIDIKKATKLSEMAAKNLIEMFNRMFPNDEYRIIKENIDCKYLCDC